MAKTLLVTGGAGFIGANFVHYWLENHPADRVIVLDALTYAGNLENLKPVKGSPQFRFVCGDILDQALVESLLREEAVDTLVHFAAESHVDRSISGPDAFIETNVVGTHTLLKAAKKVWLDEGRLPEGHRFHHVSTDEVYGTLSPDDPPFSETTPYQPNSPYSASKAASDHLVRAYHHTYGLCVTTSNCSNNYGPFHFPEKLVPLVITSILFDKSLPIYGDGKQIRDWLYVEDHARGVDLVLQRGVAGETYNIGGINEWANIDIVKLICQRMNEIFASDKSVAQRFPDAKCAIAGKAEELISYVKDRPGHDRRYAINPAKANKMLGYQPKESFESGIEKTLRWYLDNEHWWRNVMDGSYREWINLQYKQA
jgi:dTDP-glucose 4,6-dehydratase